MININHDSRRYELAIVLVESGTVEEGAVKVSLVCAMMNQSNHQSISTMPLS